MSDLDAYRASARAWLETKVAEFGAQARMGLNEDQDIALGRRWQDAKFEAGYAGIAWPREHGGQGLSPLEKLAFEQEEIKHGFPNNYFGISLGMPVPIMLRYASSNWGRERAEAALRGQEIWCQLFSEPGAGSDLAGLRTKATLDGDDWLISGQKLWTSYAHLSEYAVIVVRTDPTVLKHRGLTYFWLDMRSPGVTVRRVKLADGDSHVNEVFFDDVRVPDSQRMGAIGGGFGVAMETLFIERYIATDPSGFGPPLSGFIDMVRNCEINGRPASEDGRIRREIARNHAMRSALESINRRAQLAIQAGMEPGPEGSLHKLVSVRSRQRLSELAIDVQGAAGLLSHEGATPRNDWALSWMNAPTGRIAGGADEMLLNTIAEKILGLPQDHRPDKAVPFDQIP
jgi:alkylation response protein AidB-like acyl-CoA dehydrogenase